MKRIKGFFSKWQTQLAIILIPLVLGMAGFTVYYRGTGQGASSAYNAFFSTIRLFTANFDLPASENRLWLRIILETARCFATIATGHALFRILRPFFSRFSVKIRQYRWERKKDLVLIIGNNKENYAIYNSVPDKDSRMLLVRSLDECSSLSAEHGIRAITANTSIPGNHSAVSSADTERLILRLLRRCAETDRHLTLIVNTQDETDNLQFCKAAVNWIKDSLGLDRERLLRDKGKEDMQTVRAMVDPMRRFRIYVFGDAQYQAVYLDLHDASLGVLKYVNKYQLVASDFVLRHPFTEVLDRARFDQWIDRACVSPAVDFNFLLAGFGETNQELFAAATASFQYITRAGTAAPSLKQVRYHIFDRDPKAGGKSLNHTLYRYKDEFLAEIEKGALDPAAYFPLPEPAAKWEFHPCDVNDAGFYEQVRAICEANPQSVNYLTAAIGSDLENLDLAQRLAEKKLDWDLRNLTIFVKLRSNATTEIGRICAAGNFVPFGNEEALVFQFERIRRDTLEDLALQRNYMYDYENNRRSKAPVSQEDLKVRASFNWHVDMDRNKRASNLYSILSLRTKLQLLGLDFAAAGQKPADAGPSLTSNEEYFQIYAAENSPTVAMPRLDAESKDVYSYETLPLLRDFARNDVRDNLAVQEHYRWNAFMFRCGFVPETRETVTREEPKNYAARRHGTLTTFEGLFDFRREMAERKGGSEAQYDVVKYDYQLMDDAWWFLRSKDFEIYRRWPLSPDAD